MCLGSFPGPRAHWQMIGSFWDRIPPFWPPPGGGCPRAPAAEALIDLPGSACGCFPTPLGVPQPAARPARASGVPSRCARALLLIGASPSLGTPLVQLPRAPRLSASPRARRARRCLHSRRQPNLACCPCRRLNILRVATVQVRPRAAPRPKAPRHTLPRDNNDVCPRFSGFPTPALLSPKPCPPLASPGARSTRGAAF